MAPRIGCNRAVVGRARDPDPRSERACTRSPEARWLERWRCAGGGGGGWSAGGAPGAVAVAGALEVRRARVAVAALRGALPIFWSTRSAATRAGSPSEIDSQAGWSSIGGRRDGRAEERRVGRGWRSEGPRPAERARVYAISGGAVAGALEVRRGRWRWLERWRCAGGGGGGWSAGGAPGAGGGGCGSRRGGRDLVNAQRSDAGWVTERDRFPGRVVEHRWSSRWQSGRAASRERVEERGAQTRGESARVRDLRRRGGWSAGGAPGAVAVAGALEVRRGRWRWLERWRCAGGGWRWLWLAARRARSGQRAAQRRGLGHRAR